MGRHFLNEADRCRAAQNARRDAAAEWGMSWLERRVHDDLAPYSAINDASARP